MRWSHFSWVLLFAFSVWDAAPVCAGPWLAKGERGGPWSAWGLPSPSLREFRQLDRDGNGQLSEVEFRASLADSESPARATQLFHLLDQDHGGQISPVEFQHPSPEYWFVKLDRDGDGKITLEELQGNFREGTAQRTRQMLEALDRDVDQMISRDEFFQAPSHRSAELPIRPCPGAGRLHGRSRSGARGFCFQPVWPKGIFGKPAPSGRRPGWR